MHEEAERLEHAVPDAFTDRLAELLGHPDHDPHGDPIPSAEGILRPMTPSLEPGCRGQEAAHLQGQGRGRGDARLLRGSRPRPRAALTVREVRAIDGVVIVEDEEAEVYALGEPLAVRCSSGTSRPQTNRSGKERL